MSIKTLIAAFVLAALPVTGFAQCNNGMDRLDQQAMTCLPGTAWDIKTGNCIPVTTS
jgi:hypothetical protein